MRTSILEIEAVHFKMEQSFLKRALMDLSLLFVLIFILPGKSLANVILIGNNMSMSFDDMEATFAMKGLGVCGILQVAEPLDACSALTNKAVSGEGANTPFALIIRGTCSFATKVQNAEDAGFRAAIVYNNEDSRDLVAMDGNPKGITIYAVFVSKAAGQVLLKYAGDPNMECWILPSSDNTAWLVLAISFVSLLAISALLATFFFVRRHRLQHMDRGLPRVHQLHGMSARQVKALPSLIFSSVADDNCTSETCAICLEDYTAGEKLRVLPCHHRFHSLCIDSWLTMWRTFCPVCKRDAKTKTGEPSATENTPLLSVTPLLSSPNISAHSSLIGSPPMLIPSNSLLSHATSSQSRISHNVSLYMPRTSGSCGISVLSRDSVNIGNTSLLSSDAQSSLFSPQNSVCVSPQRTPTSVGSRYESPYISGSYNSSPQIDATFSLPPPIPSCGGSLSVISPFNSTHSLPGYQECCV